MTSKIVIEKTIFENVPWNEIPWARRDTAINMLNLTPQSDNEAPVLILKENNKKVSYIAYNVYDKVGRIDMHYLQTHIPYRNRGYANRLMGWVCEKYGKEYDTGLFKTSGISENFLRRWGFRQSVGQFWFRKRQG